MTIHATNVNTVKIRDIFSVQWAGLRGYSSEQLHNRNTFDGK